MPYVDDEQKVDEFAQSDDEEEETPSSS